MPNWFIDEGVATQTAYAQLFQTALEVQSRKLIADLSGNFVSKKIRRQTYWYYRYSVAKDNRVQVYLGPDSPAIQALIAKKQSQTSLAVAGALRRQLKIAVAAGACTTPSAQLKPIRRLAEYGFFQAGGVLVGSHAFAAYSNMLGIQWANENIHKTLDVDFARAGKNLSLAIDPSFKINTTTAIQSLEEGFLPRASDTGRSGSWAHQTDPDFIIDFLTPKSSVDGAPFECEQLGIALQPLKFMEFSLENIQQAILFNATDTAIVNVPDPSRYAVHKLIVYVERLSSNSVKAHKDLAQAAALIAVLKRDRPDDLFDCFADALGRGPGWKKRVDQGLRALESKHADLDLKSWLIVMQQQRDQENLDDDDSSIQDE